MKTLNQDEINEKKGGTQMREDHLSPSVIDEIVKKLVKKYGPRHWSTIASNLPGRIGKQCRERWHNHLNPNIKRESWTPQEDIEIINAHINLGNR